MITLRLLGLLLMGISTAGAAERLIVAAAANFVFALEDLQAEFSRAAPDVALTISTGSSGGLAAQITNGAPFDVFLSADLDYPRALIEADVATAESLRVFAIGRLVLWTTTPDVQPTSVAAIVQSPEVKRLAVANVDTAPYGRAARETLVHLGLWDSIQPKVVVGENVSQTAHYVETGNAQAGFVALSLLLAPQLKNRGEWIEVPAEFHSPLEHGVVITNRGAANPAAKRFVQFLQGEAARDVFLRFGYSVPSSE